MRVRLLIVSPEEPEGVKRGQLSIHGRVGRRATAIKDIDGYFESR